MSNMFKQMAKNTSHLLVLIWPAAALLAAASLALMYENYETSRLGYEDLPTFKANNEWISYIVAGIPVLGQSVLFYIFGRDTNKVWSLLAAGVFFVIDNGTSIWHMSGGLQPNLVLLATVESIMIYTFCAEVIFSISVGFILETSGEFIVAFVLVLKGIAQGIGMALDALGLSAKEDDQQPAGRR